MPTPLTPEHLPGPTSHRFDDDRWELARRSSGAPSWDVPQHSWWLAPCRGDFPDPENVTVAAGEFHDEFADSWPASWIPWSDANQGKLSIHLESVREDGGLQPNSPGLLHSYAGVRYQLSVGPWPTRFFDFGWAPAHHMSSFKIGVQSWDNTWRCLFHQVEPDPSIWVLRLLSDPTHDGHTFSLIRAGRWGGSHRG